MLHERRRGAGRGEEGVALLTVAIGILAIVLLTFMIQEIARLAMSHAASQAKEDVLLPATEAMVDRYRVKLGIDPSYYRHWVDEAEGPRRCTDPASAGVGRVVDPGGTWFADCSRWTYEDLPPDRWFLHPALSNGSGGGARVLLHVTPPSDGQPLGLTVAGIEADHLSPRVVMVDLEPRSASSFVLLDREDVTLGGDDRTFGPVYAGGRVGYRPGGEAHGNVYAERTIGGWGGYVAPRWRDGAQGWDSTGRYNPAGETIRDVFPTPVDFARFWVDLDRLRRAACDGGGICLDPARDRRIPRGVTAFLLETLPGRTGSRIRVSTTTRTPWGEGCESRRTVRWRVLGTYPLPANGALWAAGHVVVGRFPDPFALDGALTIGAGTSSRRRSVVVGADVRYRGSDDVLGIVASRDLYVDPTAAGRDGTLDLQAAVLAQDGRMRLLPGCGAAREGGGGADTRLALLGSLAAAKNGPSECCFAAATYRHDPRLLRSRPPFFPLLADEWTATRWRERPAPCWARAGGCP